MAFSSIQFNRSSGVGEGINAAAQNFLRAYQMGKERRLQEQQAATQQQQAQIQTAAMQREAAMAPLREAMIRGQAFQQGIKPAEQATDTTFSLPTPNTTGALLPASLPALTVDASRRYVSLGGGTLPTSQVSDATVASVPEQGGFVYDTLDNPTARARVERADARDAQVETARQAASLALQKLYSGQQFTAQQNELNRANSRDVASANRQSSREVATIRSGMAANGLQKPQEFNQKAALVAPRAAAAAQEIDQLGNPTSSLPARVMQHVPFVGQYFTSDDQQQLQQSGNVLATAILRLESGAAVSKQEAESYAKQFLPQPGDSEDVLAQKKHIRDLAIERLNAAAAPVTSREQSRYSPDNPFAERP